MGSMLQVVINALFSSLTSLLHVGVVCLLFYLLFGILGINLLKGALHYCEVGWTGRDRGAAGKGGSRPQHAPCWCLHAGGA